MKNQVIADTLRAEAAHYPRESDTPDASWHMDRDGARWDWKGPRAKIQVGRLTIRCNATREAVLSVADKYSGKGNFRHTTLRATTGRPCARRFSISALREFITDGEIENGLNYCAQWPADKLPAEAARFVEQAGRAAA